MIDNVSRQWFVVHTKVKKEEFARRQLEQRGVVTFLPCLLKPRLRLDEAIVPLFPSYLFAYLDLGGQYWDVAWTPGVRRLVGFGEAASPMDAAVMAFLLERAGEDGIVRIASNFRAGEAVRINDGPLAGLIGIIERPCSGRGRVQVLMDLLRRQTRVEVPSELIDRV